MLESQAQNPNLEGSAEHQTQMPQTAAATFPRALVSVFLRALRGSVVKSEPPKTPQEKDPKSVTNPKRKN
jgi:hypothetical protein